MPVGYLVSVVVVAIGTLFAFRTFRRPRPLAGVSFFVGLVLNEVPVAGLYWLLIATLPALGRLESPGGWATVALAGLVTAGLAVIAWRGLRAGPAIERALTEGLGDGWRGSIDAGMRSRFRRRLPYARILFRPFFPRRRDVERVKDLAYGDAGRRQSLDVYRHRSRPSGAPVLIHLHGGSYRRGRKNSQALPLLYRLASQGWVCVSANYRLRPEVEHPEHLIDYKRVIAWVREHAREYGADPAMVFAAGSSAGAHLASLAALTPNEPGLQPGFEDADTSVAAAICLYGYYGRYYGRGADSSPLAHVGPDAPPFLIAHGDRDTIVPVESARVFAGALRAGSAGPVVYAELPGAQHAFDLFHSLRFEALVDAIEAFTAWVRTRETSRTQG